MDDVFLTDVEMELMLTISGSDTIGTPMKVFHW